MHKVTRFSLIILLLFSVYSCKKNNDEPKQEESHVVRGKVYSKAFTMASGRATTDVYNDVERVIVNLSADANFNCDSPDKMSYSVYFRVPKKVGIYTANSDDIWLGFDDSATDSSVGFVGADSMVEITSVDNGKVKGKISFAYQRSDSSVDGTFEVPFCQ